MASISLQQTKLIATKANLALTEQELKRFHKDLQSIFEYASKLQEVDTSEISSATQTNGLSNVTREDEVTASLLLSEILKSSKKANGDAFEISAILK